MTNHERLAMGNFLGLLSDELEFLSKEADKYPVSTVVKNNRQRWGHAQLWIKGTKKFIQESTSATQKCFYAPSTSYLEGNANPSLQTLRDALWQCKKHEVFQDEKFDEYVLRTSQVYTPSLVLSIGSTLLASILWGFQFGKGKCVSLKTI